jgi:hypothetical protein
MARRSVRPRAEAAARAAYVNAVLARYRSASGALGHVRKADVRLARGLYDRGVALRVIEDAITVALCRRLVRTAAPLEPVRSLHYFLPVIDEILAATLDPDYIVYLRGCLARHLARSSPDR